MEQATNSLSWLQEALKHDREEWVLGTFVELICRSLSSPGPVETEISVGREWLLRWGECPLEIQVSYTSPIKGDRFDKKPDRAEGQPNPTTLCTFLHVLTGFLKKRPNRLWRTLRQAAYGEIRLTWVPVQPLALPSIKPPKELPDRLVLKSATIIDPPASVAHSSDSIPTPVLNESSAPVISAPQTLLFAPISPTKEVASNLFQGETPSLIIYCLGPFRLYLGDQLVENWSSRKALSVLKFLVTHRHTLINREVLMDTFWRDNDPDAARRSLHQAIYTLRQMLKTGKSDFPYIQYENNGYRLNPELLVWLDYEEFEKHIATGLAAEKRGEEEKAVQEFEIAESLYGESFLVEDLYENWPQTMREQFRQMYLSIVIRLANYYLQQREFAAAIAICRRILRTENSQEEAHAILMRVFMAQGQRRMAIHQYQLCAQALRNELDLPPSTEIQAIYQEITKG
jgi:DNA-binding SARP family transcriptional activator